FAWPFALFRAPGDSLVAWDGSWAQLLFDPEGRFVRQNTLDRARLSLVLGTRHFTEMFTPLSDGTIVLHAYERGDGRAPPVGLYRPPLGFIRVHPDGSRL